MLYSIFDFRPKQWASTTATTKFIWLWRKHSYLFQQLGGHLSLIYNFFGLKIMDVFTKFLHFFIQNRNQTVIPGCSMQICRNRRSIGRYNCGFHYLLLFFR